ncbi:MAG: PHP domain-containing protein, partial [Dehalococcoidia bacterium]
MSKRVDLHLHTTYSDGRLTPGELIQIAAEQGIGVIAITDHDTINGIEPALAAAEC